MSGDGGPIAPNVETLAFVQEWMMSGDNEPDQWTRDFATAIDDRSANDGKLIQALRAAQAFMSCALAPHCYSHDELSEMARATKPKIDAALATGGAA